MTGCFLDIRDHQTQLVDFRERKLLSVFGNKIIQGFAKIWPAHKVFKEYHDFFPLSFARYLFSSIQNLDITNLISDAVPRNSGTLLTQLTYWLGN
jgi:hypothetical protein